MQRRERRRAAAAKRDPLRGLEAPEARGQEETSSELHEERLDAVVHQLRRSGARTVLDLGCGSGSLLKRLAAEPQFRRIVGVDSSARALALAERLLGLDGGVTEGRVSLRCASLADPDPSLAGFDAAALVETIEHLEPGHLSAMERAVFATLRPALVVLTTPNREYNALYGLAEGERRHADHRFEWDRPRLRAWASGVARRNGYRVWYEDVGRAHPLLGGPTQMAVFRLAETHSEPQAEG